MVMGRRAGVARSSWPIATTDLVGLAGQLSTAMARVPFRRPWSGTGSLPHNLAVTVTRETIRSFMGYSSSLPIDEWRSIEMVLDDLCGVVLLAPGALGRHGPAARRPWPACPASGTARGTAWPGAPSSTSTAVATSAPRRGCTRCSSPGCAVSTGCEIFVADIRLAPEFPFPADLEDAVLVLESLLAGGVEPSRAVRGRRLERWGTGLVADVLDDSRPTTGRSPAWCCSRRSWTWSSTSRRSPTTPTGTSCPGTSRPPPYLHGRDPDSGSVSAVDQDVSGWPPTFVSFGGDEMFRDAIRRFVDPPRGGRGGHGRLRGAGHVPRVPHPDAVGRRQPPGLPGGGPVRRPPA